MSGRMLHRRSAAAAANSEDANHKKSLEYAELGQVKKVPRSSSSGKDGILYSYPNRGTHKKTRRRNKNQCLAQVVLLCQRRIWTPCCRPWRNMSRRRQRWILLFLGAALAFFVFFGLLPFVLVVRTTHKIHQHEHHFNHSNHTSLHEKPHPPGMTHFHGQQHHYPHHEQPRLATPHRIPHEVNHNHHHQQDHETLHRADQQTDDDHTQQQDVEQQRQLSMVANLSLPGRIVFDATAIVHRSFFAIPPKLGMIAQRHATEYDYGGLEFGFLQEDGAARPIFRDYGLQESDVVKSPDVPRDDDFTETYYAYDDDVERGKDYTLSIDGNPPQPMHCRRIQEHRYHFPNCNLVHESFGDFVRVHGDYMGAGAYRQVFSFEHEFGGKMETIVAKELRYNLEAQYDMLEFVRMDAIVAERLSSSPLIFDIYGHCGLTLLSENFVHGDLEDLVIPTDGAAKLADVQANPSKFYNDLTSQEKLQIAIGMAEGLAVLHGYSGGTIVHNDLQLSQFLFNQDKSILKLNDFNRAEFLLWNDQEESYCLYSNGPGHGNWRSPEEYVDGWLHETIDIWALANNFYALLTGLYVFFDTTRESEVSKRLQKGQLPYLDPQWESMGPVESLLVKVIRKCWVSDPKERPSIFEILKLLRSVDNSSSM